MTELLGLEEAADLLDVSVEQVYQLMADGDLTSVSRGDNVMALRSEIDRRIEPDS